MKKYHIYSLALLATVMAACNGNEFKVTGNIDGACDTTKLVLESSTNGHWLLVDSVKLSSNGNISISEPAPACPDIYRLRHGEDCIYFPIDSIDHIDIKGNIKSFGTDYTLSGSDNAVDVMNIDKKAYQISKMDAAKANAVKESWKTELAKKILTDPSGIVSYYIINKYINEEPLFNPMNDRDLKIIGAVANAYNTFKPNDPRTAYMVDIVLNGRRMRRDATAKSDTIYATETPLLEIQLEDKNGKTQELSKVAAKGDVIILNFTAYTAEFSPVFNKVLADVYTKNKAAGLQIYQIGYDNDEFQWRQAASNLPWISVFDPQGLNSKYLRLYNVMELPTTYILNRKGEIVEKVTDITRLDALVGKYI